MRIAISNLAWDVADDAQVADILNAHGVDAIDVAPSKYFPVFAAAHAADVEKVRGWWRDRGIAITGMQSLLFGTTGLNVFGPAETQQAMLDHLAEVCRIGASLGATRLVFGSPKNRDRSGLSDETAHTMAVAFFRRLGDIAARQNVFICLEPNPSCYGANFMVDSASTAAVVTSVAHPAIRMQLDTGAITINEDAAADVVARYASLIGHVHASEPNLVTLGEGGTRHDAVADALFAHLPEQVVTIEMLPPKTGGAVEAVRRGVVEAIRHYRGAGSAAA